MMRRWGGKNESELRNTSNRGTGDDHLFQLVGANRLSIFIPPDSKIKGYADLLEKLESFGCIVTYPSKSPEVLRELPSRLYKAINIEAEKELDYKALQLAHRWAHKRNLLHSFFIPL
ncbi:MAG: hypothetical protein CL776_00555 [Chloroflexi bacterium]|nr:hypothetical protein [Chloroflexota bacterium]|tara:strand:- start:1694 stop:2044 length:351 start_codon:yes stop_codon:yes gene_type:complete